MNYQNQPQNQSQQGASQYEKNPNGGYLNKSNYGNDSWYGKVTITPELLAEIQRTGQVLVEVKDIQTTQYGECRRVVAKPYEQKPAPMPQSYNNGHAQAHPTPAPNPAQQYNQVHNAQAPVQHSPAPTNAPQNLGQGYNPGLNDEIPF